MTVRTERDERGVVRVTLDAPKTRNALDAAMMDELSRIADELSGDRTARIVILLGAGEWFCAGGDLNWMRAQANASDADRRTEACRLAGMLGKLDRLPQAVIGRVQGGAFGGGVGLMSVCDTCIVADDARFGLTETRLGLIPATIGPYVVARIGAGAARRTMLSGERFDAAEAVQLGLATRAVPVGTLDEAIEREVAEHVKAAPGAIAAAKAMIRDLAPSADEQAVFASVERLSERWNDSEAREGIAAFFGKRKPDWIA